jgi:type IV pilus biogenesis protein CpaD/CtpE
MAKLEIMSATGALILSAIVMASLMGCASAPDRQAGAKEVQATHRVVNRDRTPSWQKYQVSGSRISRHLDANGKPTSADFVQSTTGKGLEMMPGVTMIPCTKGRSGC